MIMIGGSLPAQQMGPANVLSRLFTSGAEAVQYTDQFKNALPAPQLQQVLDQISGQLGEFQEVRGESNPYTVVFSGGTATALVQLDNQARLAGLRFTAIAPAAGSLDEAVARFRELPGEVAFLITRNGEGVAAQQADAALAVGSSFKLAVLAAVQEAVAAGEMSWDQVVRVRDDWRSLPTGLVQDWPAGSAVTVETLATLMISQSDNTATDALIRLVGRRAVEAFAPSSRPLLTTREAFILKDPDNARLKEDFLAAPEDEAREILDEIDVDELPEAGLFTGDPVSPEVEWFFSAAELCGMMEQVAELDLTTVNPGVANAGNWRRVSYKGGSEPGILNMTTRLLAADGTVYCVSVTQNRNDSALDETAFFAAYQGVLGALGQ